MTRTSRSQEWPKNDAFPVIEHIVVAMESHMSKKKTPQIKQQNIAASSSRDGDVEPTETDGDES